MVRRTAAVARRAGSKKNDTHKQHGGAGKSSLRTKDGGKRTGRVQQRGKLMLDNPIIPPELDEDIDDDLAFNSDDEEMYGHLFNQSSRAGTAESSHTTKKKKNDKSKGKGKDKKAGKATKTSSSSRTGQSKTRRSHADEDDENENEDVDDDDDYLYNYHEEGQSSDDDDGDYVDLEDMLDMSEEAPTTTALEQSRKDTDKTPSQSTHRVTKSMSSPSASKSTKTHASTKSTVQEDEQSGEDIALRPARTKRRRGSALVTEEESLHGEAVTGVDGLARSYGGALHRLVHRTADTDAVGTSSSSASAAALAAVRHRLEEAHQNRHTLLAVEADAATARRVTRAEVRAAVSDGLQRYRSTLRHLDRAPHVQLPFAAPASSPMPHSLGGVVAALQTREVVTEGSSRASTTSPAETSSAQTSKARTSSSSASTTTTTTTSAAVRLVSTMQNMLREAGLAEANRSSAQTSAQATSQSPAEGNTLAEHVRFRREGDDGSAEEDETDADANSSPRHIVSEPKGERQSYLAKLKAMLSYENSRRRRFNRIKSKTYRRILRKEKEHEKERRMKAFELLHPELARQRLAEKLTRARAHERVTQKHKNTSAWVKHAKRFASSDAATKEAVDTQLALHQRLMAKMDEPAGGRRAAMRTSRAAAMTMRASPPMWKMRWWMSCSREDRASATHNRRHV